jgi:hypothetical protein
MEGRLIFLHHPRRLSTPGRWPERGRPASRGRPARARAHTIPKPLEGQSRKAVRTQISSGTLAFKRTGSTCARKSSALDVSLGALHRELCPRQKRFRRWKHFVSNRSRMIRRLIATPVAHRRLCFWKKLDASANSVTCVTNTIKLHRFHHNLLNRMHCTASHPKSSVQRLKHCAGMTSR